MISDGYIFLEYFIIFDLSLVPHNFVGFLFLILYPGCCARLRLLRPPASSHNTSHTHVTHIFVTHHLSHNTSHTHLRPPLSCPPPSLSHISHTSPTSHTHLTHVTHHLSHNTSHTHLCPPPSLSHISHTSPTHLTHIFVHRYLVHHHLCHTSR